MKNVKTTMFTFAAAFLFTLGASAQVQEEKKLTDVQKKEIVENSKANTEKLALTEDQKGPYIEITNRYAEKLKEVRANADSKMDKLKAAKALKEEKNLEIQKILTAEQYKTYLEIQDARKQKMMDKRKG